MSGTVLPALRFLLVDDNATFLHIVKRFVATRFSAEAQVVTITGAGLEAYALAECQHPHVALVDIDMPRREGLAIIRRLRSMFPRGAIIATSLHAPDLFDYYRDLALAHGADDLLAKDRLMSQLMPTIDRLIGGQFGILDE